MTIRGKKTLPLSFTQMCSCTEKTALLLLCWKVMGLFLLNFWLKKKLARTTCHDRVWFLQVLNSKLSNEGLPFTCSTPHLANKDLIHALQISLVSSRFCSWVISVILSAYYFTRPHKTEEYQGWTKTQRWWTWSELQNWFSLWKDFEAQAKGDSSSLFFPNWNLSAAARQ